MPGHSELRRQMTADRSGAEDADAHLTLILTEFAVGVSSALAGFPNEFPLVKASKTPRFLPCGTGKSGDSPFSLISI
jgi:hypothetical protein